MKHDCGKLEGYVTIGNEGTQWWLEYDDESSYDSNFALIKIKFCPFCGKKPRRGKKK